MSDYKKAEQKLTDYLTGELDAQIEARRKELTQASGVEDPESFNDRKHALLKSDKSTVEAFLKQLKHAHELTHDILKLFYKENHLWKKVSRDVMLSPSACKARRKKAIEELEEWLYV